MRSASAFLGRVGNKRCKNSYREYGVAKSCNLNPMEQNVLSHSRAILTASLRVSKNVNEHNIFLAGSIHNFHDTVSIKNVSRDDSAKSFNKLIDEIGTSLNCVCFQPQDTNLWAMLELIPYTLAIGRWLFFSSIILRFTTIVRLTFKIQIAKSALDVYPPVLQRHCKSPDYF